MAEQKTPELKLPEVKMPDPAQMAQLFSHIAEKSQVIVKEFLNRQQTDGKFDMQDKMVLGKSFMEMTQKIMADPAKLAQAQMDLWQNYMELWQKTLPAMFGQPMEASGARAEGRQALQARRLAGQRLFSYIKQSYLLTAGWIQDMVADVEGFDDKTKKKLQFYTRQFVDALSPSNFALTNPGSGAATIESGGENLINGLKNMLGDLERGKGKLSIRMTDLDAFELGKNVATTPGQGRLPERNDAASPVRSQHPGGIQEAAADLPAVDQQVLHHGSAAQEFADQMVRSIRASPCS
jgi:polyhydroxyalkanoate synthase